MYQEFFIELPQASVQQLNHSNARSLLGSVLEHSSLSLADRQALFHRDEKNQPISRTYGFNPATGASHGAPAPVAVSGQDCRVKLLAIGPEGVELLNRHLVTIANALSLHLNSPWSVRTFSGDCKLKASFPSMFRISEFVLQKNTRQLKEIMSATVGNDRTILPTLEQLTPKIKHSLVSSLLGQAMYLDDVMGTDLAGSIPTDQRLAIKVLAGQVYLSRMRGKFGAMALSIKNLVFSMDAEVEGPWLTGQLRANGMGRIQPLFTHQLERYAPALMPAEA